MASDSEVRRALMKAAGSLSVAVSIIDNNPGDPVQVVGEVRDTLVHGLTGLPVIRPQSCPRGVHRDWWADTDTEAGTLGCPWCEIDDLRAVRVEAATS